MWRLLHSTWRLALGWGGLAVAISAAIYYGPRKMFETWDWYVYRFHDKAVFAAIDNGKWSDPPKWRFGGRDEVINQPSRIPLTTKEIAAQLGRGEDSVQHSIERLKSAKKVQSQLGGWTPL